MYGLDVFYEPVVPAELADELVAVGGRGPAELGGRLIGFQNERFGRDASTIGDAGAVCAVIDRAGADDRDAAAAVELAGTWSRGRTIVDRRDWSGDMAHDPHGEAPVRVDVALGVDGARYAAALGRHAPRPDGAALMGRVAVLGSLNVDVVTLVERHPRARRDPARRGRWPVRRGQGRQPGRGRGARRGGRRADARPGRRRRARARLRSTASRASASTPSAVSTSGRAPTGTALITVDEQGENSIIVVAGANGEPDRVARRRRPDASAPATCCSARSRSTSARWPTRPARPTPPVPGSSLNLAPYAALPPDVIALADPVVVNESEMRASRGLRPRAAVAARDLRRGGSAVGDGRRRRHTRAGRDLGDTVGAGDAFCGALAAALAGGADRQAALEAANAAGAAAVRWVGAQPDAAL